MNKITKFKVKSFQRHFSNLEKGNINNVSLFSCKKYDIEKFKIANSFYSPQEQLFLNFHPEELNHKTAKFALGCGTISAFVNDKLDANCIKALHDVGVSLIAMRCAGFNNVDILTAQTLGVKVVRVPAYSPYAVAEHAIALALALNRKIPKAHNRTREGNFALDGLIGFDFYGKTVGIIGTGKIGKVFADICKGLGMQILYYDIVENIEMNKIGGKLVSLDEIYCQSKLISLHCPLTKETKHIIDKRAFDKMRQSPIIINTGRGALINSLDAIEALKEKTIYGLGIDVYEQEEMLFFEDHSDDVISDDIFARLVSIPNVIVTGHQAFLTEEALNNISKTTLANISEIKKNGKCQNEIKV